MLSSIFIHLLYIRHCQMLNQHQLNQLDTQGFLVLQDWFSIDEVELIQSRLPALFADNHPGNIKEKSSGIVRTSMGLHLRDDLFSVLVKHPRLVEPAQQILEEPMYIQQVKVNVKAAFTGEHWQWHYDFATHHREDGVEQPLALNLHIFLDDVSEFNGPLYFIPGSHKKGIDQAWLDDKSTSYPLWIVDDDIVTELAYEQGIFSATGKKGTTLIFHDTLLHASANNISPWDRSIFSLIVNPVSNAYGNSSRPDYKHHRDLSPVIAVNGNCLDSF